MNKKTHMINLILQKKIDYRSVIHIMRHKKCMKKNNIKY